MLISVVQVTDNVIHYNKKEMKKKKKKKKEKIKTRNGRYNYRSFSMRALNNFASKQIHPNSFAQNLQFCLRRKYLDPQFSPHLVRHHSQVPTKWQN